MNFVSNPDRMKPIVISLGGSLIVPSDIDVDFLRRFRKLILKFMKNKRFIMICGGGKICRIYQKAAVRVTKLTYEDMDWLGIHATRLNAHLLRTIFRRYAHSRVISNPEEKVKFKEPILIAAGYRPGASTDYVAVLLAKTYEASFLLNLTDIDYVYDKDPQKYREAKPLEYITWKEYKKIVRDKKWKPGLNLPFDPIATKEAEKIGLRVIIMNGRNFKNLDNFLNGKKFKGTVIH